MTAPPIPGTGGGLAEALNILLDKGLVIDLSVRVTVIGIEILSIEVKLVLASVDTYIRYLEAMQRLEAQRQQLQNGGTVPPPGTQGIVGTFGLFPPMPATVGVMPGVQQAQVAAAAEAEQK